MKVGVLRVLLLCIALISPCGLSQVLRWDRNIEIDLSHYVVYRDGIAVASVVDTSFPNLKDGIYTVTAVDTAGNESGHSEAVRYEQTSPRRVRNLAVEGRGDTAVVDVGDTVSVTFEASNMLENGVVVDQSLVLFGLFYRYKGTTTWNQIGIWREVSQQGDVVVELPIGPSVTIELVVDLLCNGVRSVTATHTVFLRTKSQAAATWKLKRIRVII